jgi:hypothetical protein
LAGSSLTETSLGGAGRLASVPEPSVYVLMGIGLAALAVIRIRQG